MSTKQSSWLGSPSDFEYPPLDPQNKVFRLIRLLRPKPSLIPRCDNTLRVEIFETTASTHSSIESPYNALSYAWGTCGSKQPKRTVLVETKDRTHKLRIHRPLEIALLNLSATSLTRLPLFVDQICINQNDGEEKQHQVVLMREIYTNCASAIIWLGPATRNSDMWFDYVRERCHDGVLCGLMQQRKASSLSVFDAVMDSSIEVRGQELKDRDAILQMIRLHGDDYPLDGYQDILERSWFNRLWTIQEACLPRELIVVCGMQALCYDCVRAGMFFYALNTTYWSRHLSTPQSKHELKRRSRMYDLNRDFGRVVQERKAIHQLAKKQLLYDVMLKYNVHDDQKRKVDVLLAEDRIFGLLGLAAEHDTFRGSVRVQYDMENRDASIVRTYTRVAGLMLAQNIDTLLFNQFPKNVPGLPSWVPDWSMDLVTPIGYHTLKEPNFTTGGEKATGEIFLDHTSNRVMIKGIMFDRVSCLGRQTYSISPTSDDAHSQLHYRDATLCFDEISDFIRDAALLSKNGAGSPLNEEAQVLQRLRICDSGLTYYHYTKMLGLSEGIHCLQTCFYVINYLGGRRLKSDRGVASYSITRIYRTVGFVPWYFQPTSEMNALSIWSRGPISAAKLAYEAVRDFVYDMGMLCASSAWVQFMSWYSDFRSQYKKTVDFKFDQERLATLVGPGAEEWKTKFMQFKQE